ncbi:inositol-3-phosphate synthase [Microbacterium sp. ACRRU]|uniref:inositol-3-phosphate synthase n=1 Tax=Microbacterium sp. ACRRU TaxID=2918204 RepID=UPI001EF4922B|nr:inositol-3-phosphate synthase [Microbacterium sp. ACRRU]MCG7417777.1 inositol-3-phosphate synthase [Microbacterium sp. ACRRU]
MNSSDIPASPEVGAWFIGARGSLATTAIVGLHAVAAGLVEPIGLTTETPALRDSAFPGLADIVVGGHDITTTPLVDRARSLAEGGMFPASLVDRVSERVAATDRNLRQVPTGLTTQQEEIDQLTADIVDFRERHGLRDVVVIDVSSTEPLPPYHPGFDDDTALTVALSTPGVRILPPSSRAAAAAVAAGAAYAAFTPSASLNLPALRERADRAGIAYAGQDGKTGETLLRTVLAPMFTARGLSVRSWAGTNLLGGGDGATLSDPEAVRSKLVSKNRGLYSLVGDDVVAPLHIDNVPDLGDVKTAWDHVSAVGFLGSRVTLQTTWSAYDSALAAPLVIDLVRALALATRAGHRGVVADLACFFKDPWGSDVHAFAEQTARFVGWARRSSDAVVAASVAAS